MAIAKRGVVAEEIESDEVEDIEEEAPVAKPAKKEKKAPVVEEDETEDETEEDTDPEGLIDFMVNASSEVFEEKWTKADAKRAFKIFCDAFSDTLYNEGEVRLPNIGIIELDAVPAKEGASWLGVSEEDKAALLKKDPKSKGKKWTTEAKWKVRSRFFPSFVQNINDLAEENGDSAQAYLDGLDEE